MARLWHHDRVIPPRNPEETERYRNQWSVSCFYLTPCLYMYRIWLILIFTMIYLYVCILEQTYTAVEHIVQTWQNGNQYLSLFINLRRTQKTIQSKNKFPYNVSNNIYHSLPFIFYNQSSSFWEQKLKDSGLRIKHGGASSNGARPREGGRFPTHLDQNLGMWGGGKWAVAVATSSPRITAPLYLATKREKEKQN